MTEDEYLNLATYMILEGYNAHDDDDVMDAIVVSNAYLMHYTDAELDYLLGEFRAL